MTAAPTTTAPAKRSAVDLVAKLQRDQADHMGAIRRLERERDDLLLAKHEGDDDATRRTEEIRAELEQRGTATRELAGLVERFRPRANLEALQGKVAEKRAGVRVMAAETMAAIEAVQKVDAAIVALAGTYQHARGLMDALQTKLVPLSVPATYSPEQAATHIMVGTYSKSLRPLAEHIDLRLQSLQVLPIEPGGAFTYPPIASTVTTGFNDLHRRIQDRLKEDEAALVAMEAEIEAALAGPVLVGAAA